MTMRCLAVSICLAGMALAQSTATTTTPAQGTPQGPRGRGPGFGRGPGRGMGGLDLMGPNAEARLTKRLSLNSTQQNTLHQTISSIKVQQQGVSAKMASLRTELATAVKAGDEGSIDRVTGEISSLNQQQTSIRAKAIMAVYGSLTAEQKTTFEPLMNRELGVPGPRPAGRGPRPRTPAQQPQQ